MEAPQSQNDRNQTQSDKPPMEPSDEATAESLELARAQGEAMSNALEHMLEDVATDGGKKRAGDYMVAYATEEAEGMYVPDDDGELQWQEPTDENVHIEVGVVDGADGRFVPGLTVHATLIDADGNEVGTHEQPFLWHPWLYHYGRNWKVPGDGTYSLKVRIEPPKYARHDKKNGCRYAEVVELTFDGVEIETGQD